MRPGDTNPFASTTPPPDHRLMPNTARPPTSSIQPPASSQWGGKRPGAGAPRGNFNALRNGLHSPRLRAYLRALATDPVMQQLIRECLRVDARGGHLGDMVKHALRGVSFNTPRVQDMRARRRRQNHRLARRIDRLIREAPPGAWAVPPPTLHRDGDGRPFVFTDHRGAPFNPLANRTEPIDPMVPRTITAATRRVQRALQRQHDQALIAWFREECAGRPTE